MLACNLGVVPAAVVKACDGFGCSDQMTFRLRCDILARSLAFSSEAYLCGRLGFTPAGEVIASEPIAVHQAGTCSLM